MTDPPAVADAPEVAEPSAVRRPGGSRPARRLPRLLLRPLAGRASTLLTNGGLLVGGLLSSVLVSRVLGPAGRGQYVTWQTWASTIGVFALGGLPQVLVLDDWTPGRHKLRELATPLLLSIAAALAALAGVAAFLRPAAVVFVAAVLIVLANQFSSLGAAEAQRMGRMSVEFNAARIVPQAAALLAMGGLLVAGSTGLAGWLVAVSVAQAAATALWLWRCCERGRVGHIPIGRTLADSVRLAPGNWMTQLQYRFDLLAVTALFRPEVVAFYAIGVAAQGAVLAAGQSRGMHWFSRRQGGTFAAGAGALRRELWRTAGTSLAVAVPLTLTVRLWIGGAYGSAFLPAAPIVAVLCGVGVMQSVDYLLGHEALIAGLGGRVILLRVPGLAVVAAGFGLAILWHWPTTGIAVIPGVGYAVSSVVFLAAARSRRSATAATAATGCRPPRPAAP
ncbi:lipopolysaccharide biosynthesis protein [Rugosimonospora acidiphila]|uniref:lipopolysaccharide biosynthesis protein n=1 Tax=Rugosimonospora acidiphila TaxID=556531 RepID=UPI0031EF0848